MIENYYFWMSVTGFIMFIVCFMVAKRWFHYFGTVIILIFSFHCNYKYDSITQEKFVKNIVGMTTRKINDMYILKATKLGYRINLNGEMVYIDPEVNELLDSNNWEKLFNEKNEEN